MQPQSKSHQGSALLLLVLIISIITSIVSLTFFTLLTRYTQISSNAIKSESSYLLASKVIRDSITRHLAPAPFPPWPVFDTNNQFNEIINVNGTEYEQLISQDPSTKAITFEVTALINGNPRKLKATLTPPTIVTAKSDIILLFDTSDSMNERVNPSDPSNLQTKLEAAKIAGKSFLDQFTTATNTRIAITSYSTQIDNLRPLEYISSDIATAKIYIDNLITNGSTNIGGALQSANTTLDFPFTSTSPDRYVVLLTDGQPTVMKLPPSIFIKCKDLPTSQEQLDCLESAQNYAQQQAILLKNSKKATIFTIGLGDPSNSQSINPALLKNIATSDSNYYETPNADQLTIIYQNIAKAILTGGTLQYREVIP